MGPSHMQLQLSITSLGTMVFSSVNASPMPNDFLEAAVDVLG